MYYVHKEKLKLMICKIKKGDAPQKLPKLKDIEITSLEDSEILFIDLPR